jgi:outer membrane protein assembly factor BamB
MEWYNFRKDHQLTAHSSVSGNIKNPEIKWNYFLGGYLRDCLTIKSNDGGLDLVYASGNTIIRKNWKGEIVWQSKPFGIDGISFIRDLDGDGIEEIGATNGRELLVFSSENGELLFRYYFGPPRSAGAIYSMIISHKFRKDSNNYQVVIALWSSREIMVFDFSEGARNGKLLYTVDVKDGFHPTIGAADIDNCGEDEIFVTKLGAVYLIDFNTGKIKQQIDWISGGQRRRNYGLFVTKDINNDGNLEFTVVSSLVSRHLSMVQNDGKGNFSVGWDRFIQHIYPTDTTEVRFTYNSINDVDGDGFPEMVVSLYNTRNDGKWYTEIIDTKTGETKYEIPDTFIWGLQDIDNDGKYEIFASKEYKRIQSDYSTLVLIDCVEGKYSTRELKNNSAFATRFINSKSDLAIFRAEYLPEEIWTETFSGKPSVITIERAENGMNLCITEIQNNNEKKILFPDTNFINVCNIADLNNDGENEIVVSSIEGKLFVIKPDGTVLSESTTTVTTSLGIFGQSKPTISAIGFIDETTTERYVSLPNYRAETLLFKYNRNTFKPELVCKWNNVGKRAWNCSIHTGYAAKVKDKTYIIAASVKMPYSCLDVFDLNGDTIRRFEFKEFPPSKHNLRIGLYEWILIDEKILLVSLYKSYSMNSEETFALDFETGKILWQIKTVNEGEYGKGFGPYSFSSYLKTSPAQIDTFLMAKDDICHFNAIDGKFIKDPQLMMHITAIPMKEKGVYDVSQECLGTNKDPFTAYGAVILADVNNDGREEMLCVGCFNGMGVMDLEHNVLWWQQVPLSDLCMRFPGVTDIDNDGFIELGVGHLNGDFICHNAKDGSEKWRINLGTSTSDIITGDIDGDGFNEFIFGTADGRLMAIGNNGEIKLEQKYNYSVGCPIMFDFDGDGHSELLFVTGDGYINWLK